MYHSDSTQSSATFHYSSQPWELPSSSGSLSKKLTKEEVVKEFHELDLSGEGKLKYMTLRSALELRDYFLSDETLRRWLREADRQGKGYVDMNDYLALYGHLQASDIPAENVKTGKVAHETIAEPLRSSKPKKIFLKQAFAKFDIDGDGFITVQDLRDSFERQALEYSEGQLIDWVKKRDFSGIGAVSFNDFATFFGL